MSWLPCIVSNVVLASSLALAAWIVQHRLRRHAAARILWVLVLVKLMTPPLVSVPLRGPSGVAACATIGCDCGRHAPAQAVVGGASPWILLAAWSAGAGATCWTAWRRWSRFRRLMAHARPAPPEWRSLAARLASELSIRRPPEILAVPGRLPPLVVPGRRRPLMLLPKALMGRLNDSQRTALLLHELLHIKRGDHLVRVLESIVGAAYWWLPVVGPIGRQLRACEETCCDAEVAARLPQARREYARLLLDVLDFTDPSPCRAVPQATAMSAADDLEQRLRAILDAAPATRRGRAAGAFAVALACAILPCELRYDLAGGPPAATPAGLGPAAGPSRSPGGDWEGEPLVDLRCAS